MPESTKSAYRGYSQSQNKATQKYIREHLDCIMIRVKKGKRDYYKDAAMAAGLSLNQFIVQAMDEKIERQKGQAWVASQGKRNSLPG